MMKEKVKKLMVSRDITVKDAIRKMDETGEKILFVMDEHDKLCGSITDGDLRRWILKEGELSAKITPVYNASPMKAVPGDALSAIKDMMVRKRIDALPVVDEGGHLLDVYFWSDIFTTTVRAEGTPLKVPVLVMAGGKGTRLDPLTKILPKPLIPVGDKPIVEIIMDQFSSFGCDEFYLTVNYKGKMIQAYFDNADCVHQVHLVWEEKPTGTAGSLKLALPHLTGPHLFVSNCDILIKADYKDIFQFHTANDHDITMIGSMQHIAVPFGVLELQNGGALKNIVEKPEYDFLANTGMYLIKKETIQLIPDDTKFDFPELILKVKENGGKVGVYPISQQSWVDIGQWQEFNTAMKNLEV